LVVQDVTSRHIVNEGVEGLRRMNLGDGGD